MKLAELHRSYQVALALHEALRRVGFPPEDLYLVVSKVDGLVVMAKQVDNSINFGAGEIPPDFTPEAWTAATEAWNTATHKELQALYESVPIDGVTLVMELKRARFLLPNDPAFEDAPKA